MQKTKRRSFEGRNHNKINGIWPRKQSKSKTGNQPRTMSSTKNLRSKKSIHKENSAPSVSSAKAQPIPDFSKLHDKWQNKFQRGKACNKKPCTRVQEFKLTSASSVVKKKQPKAIEEESPLTDDQADIEFKSDASALMSILDETGVSFNSVAPSLGQQEPLNRQTGGFKTPMTRPLNHGSQTEMRRSLFCKQGPRESQYTTLTNYHDFIKSRLTLDSSSRKQAAPAAKPSTPNGSSTAMTRQRGSIYLKPASSFVCRMSSQTSTTQVGKPMRIPSYTPSKSPATRTPVAQRVPAQPTVNEVDEDPVRKSLNFQDCEESAVDQQTRETENNKEIDDFEKQVMEDLRKLEEEENKAGGKSHPMKTRSQTSSTSVKTPWTEPSGKQATKTVREPIRGEVVVNAGDKETPAMSRSRGMTSLSSQRKVSRKQTASEAVKPSKITPLKSLSDTLINSPNRVKACPSWSPCIPVKVTKSHEKTGSPSNRLKYKSKSASGILQELSPNISHSAKKSVRFRDNLIMSPAKTVALCEASFEKENLSPFKVDSPLGFLHNKSSKNFMTDEMLEKLTGSPLSDKLAGSLLLSNHKHLTGDLDDETILAMLESIQKEQERLAKIKTILQKKLSKSRKKAKSEQDQCVSEPVNTENNVPVLGNSGSGATVILPSRDQTSSADGGHFPEQSVFKSKSLPRSNSINSPGITAFSRISTNTKNVSTLNTNLCHPSPSSPGQRIIPQPGALSLRSHLNSPHQMSLQKQLAVSQYNQAVLDQEVSFFTCKQQSMVSYTPIARSPVCTNPVASILEFGDDMHFVPIA